MHIRFINIYKYVLIVDKNVPCINILLCSDAYQLLNSICLPYQSMSLSIYMPMSMPMSMSMPISF